ncbi:MAG: phospholipase D-like domain-containing protein [Elusimicrobiota bacterium]|nr:phospholipase D-like domain-containing protein [Elusimicrobiota bacterium]
MRFLRTQFKTALLFVLAFSLSTAWAGENTALSQFENSSAGIQQPAVPPAKLEITGIKLKKSQITELPLFAFSRTTLDISAYLEAMIDDASETVEVALYGMTLTNVAQALVRAKNRGVNVRIMMNQKHAFVRRSEEIQYMIDNGINIRTIRGLGSYGIMHNKIGIVDNRILSAGSFNWVVSANRANTENMIFTADSKTIRGYSRTFEWMWTNSRSLEEGQDYGSYPSDHFGSAPADTRPSLEFNGVSFPSYSFSPRGSTEKHIINAINASKKHITAAIFSFYSYPIAQALADAAKRGVDVKMIIDRVQGSQSTVVKYVMDNGVKLRWTRGHNKGVMHHKFSIMDEKILMTGSFNWSNNAQKNNFENMFYTTSGHYIKGFTQEFNEVYETAYVPEPEDLTDYEKGFTNNAPPSADEYYDPSDPYIEFSN